MPLLDELKKRVKEYKRIDKILNVDINCIIKVVKRIEKSKISVQVSV